MPFQPIVPTWLAWNNGNFTSPTAITDFRTGQPFAAGGLILAISLTLLTKKLTKVHIRPMAFCLLGVIALCKSILAPRRQM